MKNLMSEELLKQLLNKIASLESRVQFLELTQSGVNGNPDPSYWQTVHTKFTGVDLPEQRFPLSGYQPRVSFIDCPQPQAHPARCGCPEPVPPKER